MVITLNYRKMSNQLKSVKKEQQESDSNYEDVEIEPLSGKPFFHIINCSSHVYPRYHLILPKEACRMLPNSAIPVTLTRCGKSWEMTYVGNKFQKRFDARWKEFAVDNKLKAGDVCVFELMTGSNTDLKFKVQVLRGDIPSILLEREDGSSVNPIVVE